MSLPLSPAIPLPAPFINGWQTAWASNTTLTVTSGQGWDSTFTFSISTSDTITIDAATNGLNGLDTGSLAASKWYAVYVVGDSTGFNPSGCLLSLSSTSPVMPSGTVVQTTYSLQRLIGWIHTDSSSHFEKFIQIGAGSQRKYYWIDTPTALADGAATTQTAVNLNVGVPPINFTTVTLNALFQPATVGNVFDIIIANESSTLNTEPVGLLTTKENFFQFTALASLVSESGTPTMEVDYKVTEGTDSLTLFVNSFDFEV